MCLTAVLHSTPDFDHDSGVERRSGPLPVNKGNSGADASNSDRNSVPNGDLSALALFGKRSATRPRSTLQWSRVDLLSRVIG